MLLSALPNGMDEGAFVLSVYVSIGPHFFEFAVCILSGWVPMLGSLE